MNNLLTYDQFVNEAFLDKAIQKYKEVKNWYSDKNNAAKVLQYTVIAVYISAYLSERMEKEVPLEKVIAYIIAGGVMSKVAKEVVRLAHDIAGVFSPSKNLENQVSDYVEAVKKEGLASRKTAKLGAKLKDMAKREKEIGKIKGKLDPKMDKLIANIDKNL